MRNINLSYEKVLLSLRVYYFVLAALANIYGVSLIGSFRADFRPVFASVAVIFGGSDYRKALIVSSFLLLGSCLCAGVWVLRWWPKLAVFLSLLLFAAVKNAAGGITHLFQFWLWSSFMFLFTPWFSGEVTRKTKMRYLLAWWGAQAMVLLLYGLSGFWKFTGFVTQAFNGETTIFSPAGLSYHLASEVIRAGSAPLLMSWLLDHISWQPIMGLGVVAIQLFCIVGVFKTGLRPYLGLALLGFHLATFLFLSINYPTNFALIPILFLLGPQNLKLSQST